MSHRVRFEVEGFQCLRCGYKWVPRIFKEDEEPTICPKCKSPYWNKTRRAEIPTHVEEAMKMVRKMKDSRSKEDV